MADDIDLAQEREEAERQALIDSRHSPQIPPGAPGECDFCGEWCGRLVDGACGFCRDKYRLP